MKAVEETKPRSDHLVEDYFLGKTKAWGVFEDPFGRVRRKINIDLVGRLDNGTLIIDEDFRYQDGETEQRTWRIRQVAHGRYEGRTQEVRGVAIGRAVGDTVHWRYTFNLLVGSRRWRVGFREWMTFAPQGVIHRARLTKWGIRIGTVTLVYGKV
jgi:hypothetical protein